MAKANRNMKLILASCLLAAGACANLQALLQGGALSPPVVQFQEAVLVQSPSRNSLAAYTCPSSLGTGGTLANEAARLSCRTLFGPAPSPEKMQIAFDLRFKVSNPNKVPLPLAALATAVSVFPESQAHQLGDVCLALCPPTDAACNQRGQDLCKPREQQSMQASMVNFVIAQGVRLASGQRLESGLPPLSAEETMDVVARFAFAPEALLPAFASLAKQSVAEMKQGQPPSFRIPYDLRGQLHADGGALGPLSADLGQIVGNWEIPTQAIISTM